MNEYKRRSGEEEMSKHNMTIEVDANTVVLQRKLRAIAKHTEALANELDEIDKVEEEEAVYLDGKRL